MDQPRSEGYAAWNGSQGGAGRGKPSPCRLRRPGRPGRNQRTITSTVHRVETPMVRFDSRYVRTGASSLVRFVAGAAGVNAPARDRPRGVTNRRCGACGSAPHRTTSFTTWGRLVLHACFCRWAASAREGGRRLVCHGFNQRVVHRQSLLPQRGWWPAAPQLSLALRRQVAYGFACDDVGVSSCRSEVVDVDEIAGRPRRPVAQTGEHEAP